MKALGSPPYSCLITRGNATPSNFETEKPAILSAISEAIADGVGMIQIREKALPARSLLELTRAAVDVSRDTPTLVFVNDRPDVAVAAGADGVHLPQASLEPSIIRSTFGDRLVIGVSTHSLEHAVGVALSGADYIFFAPIFDTPGKQRIGVEALRAICESVKPFPVIALGGIDSGTVRDVLSAGAAGVAAIRAMQDSRSRRDILEIMDAVYIPMR